METCTNVVKLTLNLQKPYRYDQTNIQLRVSWIFDLIFWITAIVDARKCRLTRKNGFYGFMIRFWICPEKRKIRFSIRKSGFGCSQIRFTYGLMRIG